MTLSLGERAAREWGVLRAKLQLRRRGVTVGDRPLIEGWAPVIKNEGVIELGDRLLTQCFESRILLRCGPGARLSIGDRVYLNSGITVTAAADISIGNDVKIASNVAISSTAGHEMVGGEGIRAGEVIIRDNVWIGRGAFILPGVTIGANSIIGAGSVVTKDVPPDSVFAGAPARFVRQLSPSSRARK